MLELRQDTLKEIAGRTAPPMFALALMFLVCQAILVVLWVDVPNFSAQEHDPLHEHMIDPRLQQLAVFGMLAIWPIIVFEALFHWLTRPNDAVTRKYHYLSLLFCVCPSIRMCARSPEMGGRLWLPGLGWRQANKRLRKRLERKFSVPMILIALMIMPVLLVEYFLKAQVAEHKWLWLSLHVSTGIIWFAFAAEFVLMFSVAKKKIEYCKTHLIDLAIILLPVFSFLRSLRVLRAAQVTKMARVYRLRGTAAKALRALILLDFVQRIMHRNVDRSIAKLQRQLKDVEAEAKEIRRRIARLRRRSVAEQCGLEEDDLSDQDLSGEDGTGEHLGGKHLGGGELGGGELGGGELGGGELGDEDRAGERLDDASLDQNRRVDVVAHGNPRSAK